MRWTTGGSSHASWTISRKIRRNSDAPATTHDADYVFDTNNPLYAALASQLASAR